MYYMEFVSKLKGILPRPFFKALLFIKQIPKNIHSICLEFKYWLLNKYFKNYGITKKKRKHPLILSTTTFPARIKKRYLSIETIMRQTVKPNFIFLWLSEEEFPKKRKGLPKKLLDLEKRGLKIKFTKINLRSHNKLFHTLKAFPKAVTITFDDDCFYPKTFIENLYLKHLERPKDIIGYDALQIKLDKKGNPLSYRDWFNYEKTNNARKDTFLLSVNGILYPKDSFSKEVFNRKILKKICLYNDDIWFKAMSLIKGSKHRRLFKKNKQFPNILGTQQSSLFDVNVNENRNDKILEDIFERYKLNKLFRKKVLTLII